jgi:phage tail-like protein
LIVDAATIAKLLPEVFREAHQPNTVLDAALAVMENFTTPAERALSSLDSWFDPRRAPDDFLIMIATWVALGAYVSDSDVDPRSGWGRLSIDPGNLRELVARSAALSRKRGTRSALIAMLEIATGINGFTVEENPPGENGQPQSFFFRVHAPAAARAVSGIVARIVEREKPAFVTAEVVYLDR